MFDSDYDAAFADEIDERPEAIIVYIAGALALLLPVLIVACFLI